MGKHPVRAAADALDGAEERGATAGCREQGEPPVTTEGDEVEMSAVVVAFQSRGHGGRIVA